MKREIINKSTKPILYLLFNHAITGEQEKDAYRSLHITDIKAFPSNLLHLWANIPPHIEDLSEYLHPICLYIEKYITEKDFLLIQGEFGATYSIVSFSKKLFITTIYSTTKREVVEKVIDKKAIKISRFSHIKYREYKSIILK